MEPMKLPVLVLMSVVLLSAGIAAAEEAAPAVLATVTLEVNAVQVVLNDEHRQGVDWEAIVSDFHMLQLKKSDDPLWTDKKYKISVGTVSNEDYNVLLDALDTVGHMTQVPQTSAVLTADTKTGLTIALADSRAPGPVRMDVVLTNAKDGPQLRMEPYIGEMLKEDGRALAVTLKAATDVPLREGATIVLGGITSEEEITRTHKFPLLGNLPIVGLVFRSQGKLVQKTETMIFITPRFKAVTTEDKSEN